MTLNPMAHLDPIGTVLLVLTGFGWAKPVPINPYNFKNRKYGMALSALAGPASNIVVALLLTILYKIFGIYLYHYRRGQCGFAGAARHHILHGLGQRISGGFQPDPRAAVGRFPDRHPVLAGTHLF